MVKTEVACDRCGSLIVADRTRLRIRCGPLRAVLTDDHGRPALDLCRDCAQAFMAWLRPVDAPMKTAAR